MTVPLSSSPRTVDDPLTAAAKPVAHEAPADVVFPLGWLLDNAPPPLQRRALVEVARLEPKEARRLELLAYAYPPAIELALAQGPDGLWGRSMLGVPSRGNGAAGVGTIPAVRRLSEYGWDRESPPLVRARRTLFRLLAEDDDPAFLYEFAPRGRAEPELVRHGRLVLREAAAGALAQAGYGTDPRLRGAARRASERLDAFLRSPLAEKPFVRAGNQHVLSPQAAPPSFDLLLMLAYMPLFRSEHYDVVERLCRYLAQPLPRQTPASLVAGKVVPQPRLLLGDPLHSRAVVEADLPWALTWLELMARLHFLRDNEGWSHLLDRLLDQRDSAGVWRPPRRGAAPRSGNPLVWPTFPLDAHATDARTAEVTFRLGLIARLAGRPIVLA